MKLPNSTRLHFASSAHSVGDILTLDGWRWRVAEANHVGGTVYAYSLTIQL